jgi:hypothetical protein
MTIRIRAVWMLLRNNGKALAAFALTVLVCAGEAEATAIYEASAMGRLTLVGSTHEGGGTDVFITAAVLDPGLDVFAEGEASAAASGTANIVDLGAVGVFEVGDAIEQTSSSSGEASNGHALSSSLTDAFVDVDNASPFDVTLFFSFDYRLSVSTSATNGLEFAEVSANAFIFSTSEIFLDDHLFSTTELGGGPLISADVIEFSLTVPASQADSLAIFIDTDGIATAVPEPPALGSLFLVLLAVRLMGARTRATKLRTSQRASSKQGRTS